VIDAERLRRQGALALRRNGGGFNIDAVKPRGIDRPWSPGIAGEGDVETNILAPRRTAPRAVDATTSDADLQAEE
jgi:competence protein ComEC